MKLPAYLFACGLAAAALCFATYVDGGARHSSTSDVVAALGVFFAAVAAVAGVALVVLLFLWAAEHDGHPRRL